MDDRIAEIKTRCEAAISGSHCSHDIHYLLTEIDHLKMMLDAAAVGQETMQRKMAERNENLRLDYLDAVAERDMAVGDLYEMKNCDNCKKFEPLECNLAKCEYEWRGVK